MAPTASGKAATVWRKGADGSWKCVVDIWNDGPGKPSEPLAKP
jgi:ketosteroid isomerase-like protein